MIEESCVKFLQEQYGNKNIVIVGLGREGISSYQTLRAALPDQKIILFDNNPLEKLDPTLGQLIASDPQAHFTSEPEDPVLTFSDATLLFKTPGIPSTHPLITRALDNKAQVTSNTAVFFQLLKQLNHPPQTIGITGTKGKSTTTSLIYHVLQQAGKNVLLAGNIGVPALTLLEKIEDSSSAEQIVVLELSSHQLLDLNYSPDIAVVLNVTPEHLDYYDDFKQYQNAKNAIAKHQNEHNVIIYSPDFPTAVDIAQLSPATTRYTYSVNSTEQDSLTAYVKDEAIYVKSERIMAVADIPLVGTHNLLNVIPSILISHHLGIDSASIAKAVASFTALPHRLEYVTTVNQVKFFNDSQATTPEAAIAALSSFPNNTVHLLAGGSDKGVDLSEFTQAILKSGVKSVLLFPPLGDEIEKLIKNQASALNLELPELIKVTSMNEAVTAAFSKAKPGEVILLSPACASFGMFKNYQDRGDQFKACVKALA